MHPTQTNESGWKKDTKQKNTIHQICQKIQSNSNTVKAALTNTKEYTLLKIHSTKQTSFSSQRFVPCEKPWKVCLHALFTHLHGRQHSHDVICQNHWQSYFHHISQRVFISLKQQNPHEHDWFYCAGITAMHFEITWRPPPKDKCRL